MLPDISLLDERQVRAHALVKYRVEHLKAPKDNNRVLGLDDMNSGQMVHITPKLVLYNELFVDIMAFESRNSILLGGHLPVLSQVVSKVICSSVDNQLLLN